MKKVYILFPTIAMLVFFGYWWNFNSEYQAKEDQKAKIIRSGQIAKLEKEALDRKTAIEAALASQKVRRAEKAAKEAKKQADREARLAAIEARRAADREKTKLSRQVTNLQESIKTEKTIIAKIQENIRVLVDEEAFLREYVTLGESNSAGLTKVYQRIEAADAAWQNARDAAAAAAAKNKS